MSHISIGPTIFDISATCKDPALVSLMCFWKALREILLRLGVALSLMGVEKQVPMSELCSKSGFLVSRILKLSQWHYDVDLANATREQMQEGLIMWCGAGPILRDCSTTE
ncbi:hypothetical protein BaRGS_00031698 [Batillaria attramentaria]|uniref:Uncharacterized protein n=1 Tax=Batillaria attramentaria TaxID=370345 RepID=A0ABD0JQ98_9CAEN